MGGHCHVNILRTRESPDCLPNAIHYIVKYNFKSEPSRARVLRDPLPCSCRFKRGGLRQNFQFRLPRVRCNLYLHFTQAPGRRLAAYARGEQVQLTAIEKYFARPAELSQLRIQAFFSLYDVAPLPQTNLQILATDIPPTLPESCFPDRPRFSLRDPSWTMTHLPELTLIREALLIPAHSLPNARALTCRLRNQPAIVLTDKFPLLPSDPEPLSYAILLLSSCWRCEAEVLADCATYTDALAFHGLQPIEIDEITRYNHALIDYMLATSRYSPYEMAVTISRMPGPLTNYLHEKMLSADPQSAAILRLILGHLQSLDTFSHPIQSLLTPPDSDSLRQFMNCDFLAPEIDRAREHLRVHLPQLNQQQRTIFDRISRLFGLDISTNMFISGAAGTGKSFLIRTIQAYCTTVNMSYVTCASTGIAAQLIGGRTVHSTFRIYDDGTGVTKCGLDISRPVGRALSLCRLITIDEVTMIPKPVLEAVDFGLRRLAAQTNSPNCNLPFAGKHVLLFGDLAQVPAVVRARDDYGESANQFFEASPYAAFSRQDPNQQTFMTLLNDVRNADGHLTPDSISLLRSRFLPGRPDDVLDEIDDFVGKDDPNGMVICFTNLKASLYNNAILTRRLPPDCPQPLTLRAKCFVRDIPSYRASPTEDPDVAVARLTTRLASHHEIRLFFGAFRKRLINTIVPVQLHVCPRARVMLLQNLDMSAGLINGWRGTVLEYIDTADAISVRWDGSPSDSPPTLITRTSTVELPLTRSQHMFMFQFPLRLSWAVTAHKSQGQTLSRIAIDISDNAFAHGALYVALSRVRSLSCIRLFGLPEFPDTGPVFHVNPYIQFEDYRPLDDRC